MDFLDRKEEFKRLNQAFASKSFSFVVLWGRRRVGKSRLLIEWNRQKNGLYWVADESVAAVQRAYFAEALSERFPGINDVDYPDWRTLFKRLTAEIKNTHWKGPLIIDELPYLVAAAKELPSVMQNWIDQDLKPLGFNLIVAGSSQSMMQGLVLSEHSPLYGRATELIKLSPLAPKYLEEGLGIKSAIDQVTAYTLWGGVPRYWELAENYGDKIAESAYHLILRPEGILNQEPNRLLLEESPNAISLRPILDVIGMGAHKTSEIAARLFIASTSLSKPLARLQELDLIERELPFGESEKSGKRSLYKIKDPLFRLWFDLVSGRQSHMSQASKPELMKLLDSRLPQLTSRIWEDLCRKAFLNLPKLPKGNWSAPARYWHGNGPEWDLISTSLDTNSIIIGECKWFTGKITSSLIQSTIQKLIQKGIPPVSSAPFSSTYFYLFIPEIPEEKIDLPKNVRLIDAKTVIKAIS